MLDIFARQLQERFLKLILEKADTQFRHMKSYIPMLLLDYDVIWCNICLEIPQHLSKRHLIVYTLFYKHQWLSAYVFGCLTIFRNWDWISAQWMFFSAYVKLHKIWCPVSDNCRAKLIKWIPMLDRYNDRIE